MKPIRIVALVLFAALTCGVGLGRAEDQAPAAVPPEAAPADNVFKATEPGCMPDGGCCGHGACAHAAGADKTANGATGDSAGNAADTGGGCPCSKMKKKAM